MDEIGELPIWKGFDKIKDAILSNSNLILKSPTGSGKSVGLPLILLKENLINGQILVVQPRRIAARFLANRVAKILQTKVGELVGYQVRFEDLTTTETKVIYLTDGVLFRKILTDPFLSRVGLVIFDEFHERSLQMDTSLALLRRLQETKRPSLRLIVTSATLSSDGINQYLGKSKSIELFARNYPVEIEYRPVQRNEVLWKKVSAEVKKSMSKFEGHCLVFASGSYEISKIIREIHSSPWAKDFLIKPLYGDMRLEEQELALKPSGQRKIIVSTNIAETSLTIEGVRIVIDTGIAKKSSYDPIRGVNVLLPQLISKSAADQRAGRAGRTSSGYCIRLWGEKEHQGRQEEEIPAIKCQDLSEIYLNLVNLGEDPDSLAWLQAPSNNSLDRAKDTLRSIGALTHTHEITDNGRKICQFPLRPRLAMALLMAKELGCLPAFALAMALMEDRSPIIHKDFNRNIVDSYLLQKYGTLEDEGLNSDLKLLLGAWAYAKNEEFSVDRCKYVGIHAFRCREAERLAKRFCRIAGLQEFSFEIPKIKEFAEVLLVAFPDHLAVMKSRGTMMYESINGINLHLNKYSEVQKAQWVVALNLLEKPIKGKIGLEMEFVTEVKEEIIIKAFGQKILNGQEVILDQQTRKVIKRNYDQLGTIKYNIRESESATKEDIQHAYSNELKVGNLHLKNWNAEVENFLQRVCFITQNYPEYLIPEFNEDSKNLVYEEICANAKSWKEIRNREVLPIILRLYSRAEKDLLTQAIPQAISLRSDRRPYRVEYLGVKATIRVSLQDLYEVKVHPKVVFDKHLVTMEILAPNSRCVQITNNLKEFWNGSYPDIKKELSGRYPKHEWR
jgi:ATP-dependent helicase HrpB